MMTIHESMHDLFAAVARGELSPDEAAARAQSTGLERLGFAVVDHDRQARCGFAEVVFAERKQPEQVVRIVVSILKHSPVALVTRTPEETATLLQQRWPDAEYNPAARTVVVGIPPLPPKSAAPVVIVAAGTSDLPVAEEAEVTARAMGVNATILADVGVAGLHRLLAHVDMLRGAAAIIVVAGMEGALPSVVGGLVRAPVIAVPTSVGYGASFGGLAALLGMLNSCAAGVSVVNIDNGFGAGAVAARIVHAASVVPGASQTDKEPI